MIDIHMFHFDIGWYSHDLFLTVNEQWHQPGHTDMVIKASDSLEMSSDLSHQANYLGQQA